MIPHQIAVLLVPLALALNARGAEATPQVKPGVRTTIQFKESPPLSNPQQIQLRLGTTEDPAAYDITGERFEILVPKGYKDSQPHGLFVWISPGEKPSLPADWDKVLGEKKLVFIGAHQSGNNREVFDRIRLAVDANDNVRLTYKIDDRRVYVSGHSGGARVASMVAVAYSDMFTGAACFMGVNYFRDLPAKDGTLFEKRYLPNVEMARGARDTGKFALVTGEKDFNRVNTQTLFEKGFEADKFQHVKLFDIPGQGHGLPSAQWLEKVIDFLDKGK